MWECLNCGAENDLDPEAEEGHIVECEDCGGEYEIVRLDPLEFEPLNVPVPDDDEVAEPDDDEDEDDWNEE